MKPFGIAIIGCGAVAKNHGKALQISKYGELRYCVDIDIHKAKEFSQLYGGEPVECYEDLFKKTDVDIVHVVTPHFTHAEIAIACMEHNLHVFCEKPLAIHVSDGKRMVEAAEKSGRYLGVCFQNRLNDATVRAKKILERVEYGKILSAAATVRWNREGEYYSKSPWRGRYESEGGGCIINQSIHTIDLLQYLTGGIRDVTAIDAHLRSSADYEVDDSCMANFTLKNGGSAVGYFTNCALNCKTAVVEIFCEKAVLTIEQKGLTIHLPDETLEFANETASGEKSEWGLSHGKMIETFYMAVSETKPFPVDGTAAIETLKIIAAIQQSKGRRVELR